MRLFALSFHADYKCRHSGVCCSSDWDVPVELPIYRTLDEALKVGRVIPAAAAENNGPVLVIDEDMPDEAAAMLARTPTGDCVFYHRKSGLCVVHRDGGESHLPMTCRHFPRLAVRDWRGTFISLTHFCPTAASMLFRDDCPTQIVEAPPAFPPADYEGLTVEDDAWPPLLHPRMLMDTDSYDLWERHMVARCATPISPEGVLVTLRRDVELLRSFVPGSRSLAEAIRELPTDVIQTGPHVTLASSLAMRDEVLAAIPDDLKPAADEDGLESAFGAFVAPGWAGWSTPLNRYLAAKAFANWTAYQGRGIRSIVRGLEAALALVRVEAARQCRNAGRPLDADLLRDAIRYADYALNHLAVGEDLAEGWSKLEEERA